MPAYDGFRFTPPAPLALVTCKNPENGAICTDVPMLIDTGADVSLLPRDAVARLGLGTLPDRQYELVGFDGSLSTAAIVHAVVVFCGRKFRGQYLVAEHEYGILGRNLLNALAIVLDGPSLTWSEQRQPT